MAENMNDNARYIYSFFKNKGWTSNSICGMLGNMQGESGIIADIDEISGGGGYGLVQWTPKSILTNWASQNGLDYKAVDT
ncbi:phage tail tip lysozyme, partial [Clostridium sp. BL-8]|uniref:phage tail tip lysozyme n=1 Tax=Clostridium sp. BL-8 TaxID=349938 RepID=UPI001FA9023A